jgi:hypothetical protein
MAAKVENVHEKISESAEQQVRVMSSLLQARYSDHPWCNACIARHPLMAASMQMLRIWARLARAAHIYLLLMGEVHT